MRFGAILACLGVVSSVALGWSTGLAFLVIGALLVGSGLYLRRNGESVQLVNQSYDAITRGRLGAAEALLDRVEAIVKGGYLARNVDVQRALIALRRGDLAEALHRADAAVTRPVAWIARGQERVQIAGARSIRALLRATRGDAQGARDDAAGVYESPDAAPDMLARAKLAEAIVIERSSDREALRVHLDGARTLLLEYTAPRERAVVRAYQRMLEARRSSVYREGAPREPAGGAGDEPTLADWMATVVPAAAPFARTSRAAPVAAEPAAPALVEVIDPVARKAAAQRVQAGGARRWIGRVALGYLLLIVMFVGIWQFLAPSPSPHDDRVAPPVIAPVDSSGLESTVITMLSLVLAGALIAALRYHGHRQARRLFAALGAVARDDEARGEGELRALATSRYPLIAGRAWQELAVMEERRGAFVAALDACDRGLAQLSKNPATRTLASAILLPELVTERAIILAATDRDAEAGAEMALLAETYPSSPFRARSELRVELLRRVRRGDLAGAAALVARGTDDIPLNLRDEALADMVRAAVHPESAGAGEILRLKQELRADARLRRWLELAAPAAVAAFTDADRAPAGAEDPDDAEAEREAAAALEGEAAPAPVRTREDPHAARSGADGGDAGAGVRGVG
jgi:hypothetical protein